MAGNKERVKVGEIDMDIEPDGTIYVDFTDLDEVTTRLVSAKHLTTIQELKGKQQKGE